MTPQCSYKNPTKSSLTITTCILTLALFSCGGSKDSPTPNHINDNDFSLSLPYPIETCTAGTSSKVWLDVKAGSTYSNQLIYTLVSPDASIRGSEHGTITPGTNTVPFTIITNSTTPAGTYPLSITVKDANNLTHNLSFNYQIVSPTTPNFVIYSGSTPIVKNNPLFIWHCTSILAAANNGYNENITISPASIPAGFAFFNLTAPVNSPNSSWITFDVSVASNVQPGNYMLILKATDGNLLHLIHQPITVE